MTDFDCETARLRSARLSGDVGRRMEGFEEGVEGGGEEQGESRTSGMKTRVKRKTPAEVRVKRAV